jgi:hypothetical protein
MASEKLLDALAAAESLTCTVKVLVPLVVGVPLITPAELSDSPAGRAPEVFDHVFPPEPPEADSVLL